MRQGATQYGVAQGEVAPARGTTPRARPRPRRRRLSRHMRQIRGVALIVLVAAFAGALWSYIGALTAPGTTSVGGRTIEWISNDVPGGRPVVLLAEHLWYSWTAPPAGGTPSGGLPQVSAAKGSTPVETLSHLPAPQPVAAIVSGSLAGEGQWQTAGRLVGGLPALRITYIRPDPDHTSVVAGLMWFDTKLVRAELVPGMQVPDSRASWAGLHYSIPPANRSDLVATFNSAFLLRDSGGGWYGQGRTASPLLPGMASLVIYTDGTATVAQWGRDAKSGAKVAAVRQNLRLIVDNGELAANVEADDFTIWGKTPGNNVLVWRSGVGVTGNGALIYAAGDKLSVKSLATVLRQAGAVRAMQLDINSLWTSANYYTLASGDPQVIAPTKLFPTMRSPATRFLVPDNRDFVAIFARRASSGS